MTSHIPFRENLIYATYYAPRGRKRLYHLGNELSQRYLAPDDLIIGVLGAEGSGKSILIKALFPGLELTNDDDGVNLNPAPIYNFDSNDFFSPHTFHLDIRYEMAFHQKHEIVEAIQYAVQHNRRVVVEHFNLVYEDLGFNAQILFGVGEEVIVSRPTVLGPTPEAIKNIVERTIKYRKMAHTAEDLTTLVLSRDYNYEREVLHSDVKHGFVIRFHEKPEFSLEELENKIIDIINQDIPIVPEKDDHFRMGEESIFCTGVRTHVKSTGKIDNFHLHKELKFDPLTNEYLLIGTVGRREMAGYEDLMPLYNQ